MAKKTNLADIEKNFKEILLRAKAEGIADDPYFLNHLSVYKMQLQILKELEEQKDEYPTVVMKRYTGDKGNPTLSPIIQGINTTIHGLNSTVSTLMKVLEARKGTGKTKKSDLEMFLEEQ